MGYDRDLDARVSAVVLPWGATRKTMFGGTGYMVNGHLIGGVYKDRLLVRLSESDGAAALNEPDTAPFDMMPRPMPGWVTVAPEGLAGDRLDSWLERGREYAESLPPKEVAVTTGPTGGEVSPEAELQLFINRFDSTEQELFRSVRATVRRRFPTANELVYDYPDSVVIGYSPTDRGIEAIVAVAARDDGVFLYLSHGPQLPDPKKLLHGSGKQVRFIRVESAGQVGHPDVEALILEAIDHATVPLPSEGSGKLIIQSSAAKSRPRRKPTK